MLPERLEEIDRELSAFDVSEERLASVAETARSARQALGVDLESLDAALESLSAGLTLEPLGARPTTWDEARSVAPPEEQGSGTLDISESLDQAELPPVLAITAPPETPPETPSEQPMEAESTSVSERPPSPYAAYIDPPTHPPPSDAKAERAAATEAAEDEAFALDLDPEAGLVEPGAAPLSYAPPARASVSAPRPSSAPVASTEDMLAEMLDAPESVETVAIVEEVVFEAPPSVAEDETADALAAIEHDVFEGQQAPIVGSMDIGDEEEPERTVMMKASALLPPQMDGTEEDEGADFELDIDEDFMVIEEDDAEEAAAASERSRPPPPPSRPAEGRSRPPEPPGKGFLSRILKGNK